MAGESLDNPVTGEFGVIVKAPWEGEDRSFEGELFGLLRPIARARGHRGTYPQYGRSLLAAG